MNRRTLIAALAASLVVAVAVPPAALAQTGQQKYVTWRQGCHGNPANNTDNALGASAR